MPPERRRASHIGKTQQEMLEEIYDRVVGDGTPGNPGLTVEVDRLKTFARWLKWGLSTAGAVVITAVTGWLLGVFRGR